MASEPFGSLLQFLRRSVRPSPGEVPTDRQLLARFAAQRDEEAFVALVQRHGPMVWAVARRVLGHRADADDAFQATFLVLAEKSGARGWQESVGSWLYQVANRVASKLRGDAARRRRHERQVPPMAPTDVDANPSPGDLRAVLDEELTRLPDKYRAPLVLCYLEGKTNEAAAAQLGWTKGTVSGRLARARDLLRARLSRRGLALPAAALAGALIELANAAPIHSTLSQLTVRAAVLGTAAQAVAVGVVPASVGVLAQGVIRTMFLTKLKIAASLLVTLGLLGTGVGLAARHALASGTNLASLVPATEATASEPARKDGLAVTAAPQPEARATVIRMERRKISRVFSQFSVQADGKFNFDGRTGTMPRAEIAALIDQIARAKDVVQEEGGYIVTFHWTDGEGKPQVKTLCERTPDAVALLEKLATLKAKYAQEQDPARRPTRVVRMERLGDRGPQAGKIISEFEAFSDGTFTYDSVKGTMPKQEVIALGDQVAQATNAEREPVDKDAGTVRFYWLDKDGREASKLYKPGSPECLALMMKIGKLTRDGQPDAAVVRIEVREFGPEGGKLVELKPGIGRKYEVKGGKVVAEFTLNADGEFAYQGAKGKLPKAEIEALLKDIVGDSDGLTAASIRRSFTISYTDESGARKNRLLTGPGLEAESLHKKLADLKAKYAK